MEIVKSTVLESTPFKFIKSYEIEIVLAKNDDFRVTQLGCVLKFMHKSGADLGQLSITKWLYPAVAQNYVDMLQMIK